MLFSQFGDILSSQYYDRAFKMKTTVRVNLKPTKAVIKKIKEAVREQFIDGDSDYSVKIDKIIDDQIELCASEILRNPSIIIHNALTTAGHNLNRAEQKLILIAFSKTFSTKITGITKDSFELETKRNDVSEILITVKDIEEMCAYDYEKARQFLLNAVRSEDGKEGLATRMIVFNKECPNFNRILEEIKKAYAKDSNNLKITKNFESAASWLAEGYKRDEGWVKFRFSETALAMLPKNLDEGNFTSFKLKAILKLEREHAIRLYMMLTMRQSLNILTTNLEDIYLALDIPNTYSANDAKKRYINPAVEEINSIFDINLRAIWTRTPGSGNRTLNKVKFSYNGKKLYHINQGGLDRKSVV